MTVNNLYKNKKNKVIFFFSLTPKYPLLLEIIVFKMIFPPYLFIAMGILCMHFL